MQVVHYNIANTIILPLDSNGFGTYYLFEIYSEMTNTVVKTFVTTDTSTAEERLNRFNKFVFTEVGIGGTENFYSGRIRLNDGTYLLRVYQQSSSGSIVPSGNIVYRDVLKVFGNPREQYEEYNGTPTDYTPYEFL